MVGDFTDLSLLRKSGSFSLFVVSIGVSLSKKDSSKSLSLVLDGVPRLDAEGGRTLSARLETGGLLPFEGAGGFRWDGLAGAASRLRVGDLETAVDVLIFKSGRRR